MSNAARKARKRAGEKIAAKPVKIVTPVEDRAQYGGLVMGVPGTKYAGQMIPRSKKKFELALKDRGLGGDAA